MEEGERRCGRAWSNTSHYGVNCSNGDVALRAQRSQESDTCVLTQEHMHAHTHTRRKSREHLDMCHLPKGSHLVYTQCGREGGVLPSWMCNLHASSYRWERMEDKVESEERANEMTHFAGIKCLSKQGYCEEAQEMERNAHRATSPLQTPIMSPQLLVLLSCRDLFPHECPLMSVTVYPESPFKAKIN